MTIYRSNDSMADKFPNFAELKASEPESSYHIEVRVKGTAVALIAPHGGKIEPGTSEICRSVAGNDFTYYLFEGRKSSNNRDLHITSSRFDEPQALSIAGAALVVVTFHGQQGVDQFINVGGRAEVLCNAMIESLNSAGFSASRHKNPMLQGRDSNNICNRGSSRQGIQLEISRALREHLKKDRRAMNNFSEAVRSVLLNCTSSDLI